MLTGCKEKINEVEELDKFSINTNDVEVYSEIKLFDIINNIDENVEILSDNYKLDTENIGNKEYEILYKFEKKKYLYKFNINVVDTESPIVFSGTNRTVLKGYGKDLCDLITYGDNYTGDLKCVINGDYDINKVGTYKLIYSISDSSNNTKDVNVTLNVVNSINNNVRYSTLTTPIKEVFDLYKEDNNEIGIDVSEWQGNIDFNKVKESGITFVIMRIGVQINDELPKLDGQYLENIRKAKEAGLKVGVYLFTIAGSTKEIEEQVDWVIDTLNGEKLDLGIAFDWENWKYWNSYKISFHEMNEIANTFMNKVEEKGYKAMLYSSKFYLETMWKNKYNYPVWLAHYIDGKTDYKGDYKIWQLCNNGRVPGIYGDVDINIMYEG